MGTGYRGTFVISWVQTEIDGVQDAPEPALQVGAAWSWSGEPVRVDGPASLLPLGERADQGEDIRPRAARMVRRLVGAALAAERPRGADLRAAGQDVPSGDSTFVVTDGRKGYTVTLIPVGPHVPPLLMCLDELPPAGVDLWVVHHVRSAQTMSAQADPGGVICFTPRTRILTPRGPVPVGLLREGDLVQTKDSGAQPICWIGSAGCPAPACSPCPPCARSGCGPGRWDWASPTAISSSRRITAWWCAVRPHGRCSTRPRFW